MSGRREEWSFGSCPVLAQNIAQCLQSIKSAVNDGNSIQVKDTMKVLLDGCQDENAFVSDCCCSGLVQLVKTGYLETENAITSLLNITPSSHHYVFCVRAVMDLLVLHVGNTVCHTGMYLGSYGTRSNLHPLTSLVRCQVDMWRIVLMEIESMFHTVEPRLCSFLVDMLQPYLKHQLLDTSATSASLNARTSLYASLLRVADMFIWRSKGETNEHERAYLFDSAVKLSVCLVKSLSFLQTKTMPQLTEAILNFQLVANWFLTNSLADERDEILNNLLLAVINLSCEVQAGGLSVLPLIQIAHRITRHGRNCDWDVCLCGTVYLLLNTAPTDRLHLLYLCKTLIQLLIVTNCRSDLRCILAIVVYPMLQIVVCDSSYSVTIMGQQATGACQSLADEVLCALENCLSVEPHETTVECRDRRLVPGATLRILTSCCFLTQTLLTSEDKAMQWIGLLNTNDSDGMMSSDFFTLVVASLVVAGNETVRAATLPVVAEIAEREPQQALYLLNLILYQLKLENSNKMKFRFISYIPLLATHKFCIPAVMKILQTFARNQEMQPVAVRLMCKLWEKQDRVYPYLLRVVSASSVGQSYSQLDLKIAQAACIQDICRLRASQHGSDLLGLMSKILNDVTGNSSMSPEPAALSLEALKFLCEEEVLDLMSAWSLLAGKLKDDERPLILVQLCSLVGLVPQQCDSSENDEFKNDAIRSLWEWSQHANPLVSKSAYQSLSHFRLDDLKFNQLPLQIQQIVLQRVSKTLAAQLVQETSQTDDSSIIPGAAMIYLLENVESNEISGLAEFLTAMLSSELDGLPRGVARSAQHSAVMSGPLRVLAGLPSHLEQLYEKPLRPGMSKHMAAGLLLCSSILIELEFKASHKMNTAEWRKLARKCTRYMTNFIYEISILPSNWLKLPLVVKAWMLFMEVTVKVLLEGRCTEISEFSSDTPDMPAEHGVYEALLWVQDQIVEQLQPLSRGTPGVQSNSLYALCGLACSLFGSSFEDRLRSSPLNVSSPSGKSILSWLGVLADTFLVILDSNYEPQDGILDFCGVKAGKPVSAMARVAAVLCLAELSSWLFVHYFPKFQFIVGVLMGLASRRTQSEPNVVSDKKQMSPVRSSCCFALGVMLDRLTSGESEGEINWLLKDIVKVVQPSAFENRNCGLILTAGVLVKVISRLGMSELQNARRLWSDLRQTVVNAKSEEMAPEFCECCCLAFSSSSLHLFEMNLLTDDEVMVSVNIIRELNQHHSKVPGICASLGGLVYGAASYGLSDAEEIGKQLLEEWLSSITSDAESGFLLPQVWGLVGLFGCLMHIPREKSFSGRVFLDSGLLKFLNYLKKMASLKSELCAHAAWFIGLVASTVRQHDSFVVPIGYDYLPETSILRSLFDWLRMTCHTASAVVGLDNHLNAVISALTTVPKGKFPPADWNSVLTALVHCHGDFTTEICLKFASVHVCTGNVMSFVKTQMSQQRFNNLSLSCKKLALSCFPGCALIVPHKQLDMMINEIVVPLFKADYQDKLDLCREAFAALLIVLRNNKMLSAQAQDVVFSAVLCIVSEWLSWSETLALQCIEIMSDCLAQLQAERLRHILTSMLADFQEDSKQVIMHSVTAVIVERHHLSLSWLELPITYLLSRASVSSNGFKMVLNHVLDALSRQGRILVAAGQHADIVVWSLELMGYVRSFSQGQKLNSQTMKVVLLLLCHIWSVSSSLEVGNHLVCQDTVNNLDLSLLPSVFSALTTVRHWDASLEKLASWLRWATDACSDMLLLSSVLEACFRELRHCTLYRQVLPAVDLLS